MAIETVPCQYCGKEIAKSGIKNHEKSCANKQNKEENLMEDVAVNSSNEVLSELKEAEPAVDIVEEPVKEVKLVEVKLIQDLTCNIAGVLYSFQKDVVYEVPENIKEILVRANMLRAI